MKDDVKQLLEELVKNGDDCVRIFLEFKGHQYVPKKFRVAMEAALPRWQQATQKANEYLDGGSQW